MDFFTGLQFNSWDSILIYNIDTTTRFFLIETTLGLIYFNLDSIQKFNNKNSINGAGKWFNFSWFFMDNWFVASQWKAIQNFVKCSWGRKFGGKGNSRNPQTLIPHEKWWFGSTCKNNTHNQIKGAGLSWSFLDYINLLKMKSSVFEIYQTSQIFNLKYIVFS